MDKNEKHVETSTGVIILNKDKKVFLMRSPGFNNLLVVPGGHVDYGERAENCAEREVLEETGLKIKNLRFIRPVEIFGGNYIKKDKDGNLKHVISLNYAADLDGEDQKPVLDGREAMEFEWLSNEELQKREDVDPLTKESVQYYLENNKKSFFNKDCKKCKAEIEEYKSGWQRALADYKNLQAEVEKRRSEWVKMSEAQILEEFIPVYDNFKKAFATDGKNADSWAQGIEYIKKQFADILKNHGVEEIKTVGEKFNPNLHEAVGDEEAEGKEHGEILKEIDGGYMVGGKVLKVARVIVSK